LSLSKSFGALVAVVLACVAVPSFAIASPPETVLLAGPEALVASSTVTFAFAAEGGHTDTATFQCRLDSTGEWEACESPVTYTGLADGAHHFEVRAADDGHHGWPWWHHDRHWGDGGHWGAEWHWGGEEWECFGTPVEVDFTVDTTPPTATIDAAPVGTIDSAEATIEFGAEEAAEFECLLDGAPTGWAPCASPTTLTGLADGGHRFEVRARDAAGNVSPAAAVSFAVDTTLPETLVETAPAPRIDVGEASFTFTSTAGTAFECRLDPQPDSPWEACPSTVSFTGLAQGQHTFEVRAADRFGRFDPTPARVTFFVDIPVNGARLEAVPLTGTVRIKAPGATGFRPLTEGETIAVGSVVDTTAGKVSLTSVDATGEEQRASFFSGLFQVNQQPGRRLVTLALRGAELGRCGGKEEAEERPVSRATTARASAAGASAKAPKSSLWGSGHGSFRTEGHSGSATVEGTIWLTEDTCAGTFVKVNRGLVAVRDFARHKTVSVPAGHSYLARTPGA
jgi:hypothetical protein